VFVCLISWIHSGAVRNLGAAGGDAGAKRGYEHGRLDSRRLQASLDALAPLSPRQRLGLFQGLLAGEQLGLQAPTGNIIEIKEHGLPAIGKTNLKGSAAGQGFVFANLDARGHAGTQVEVDRAQFCSIKPAIVRPAARRDRKPVLSEAARSETGFIIGTT
jgi:hypothetical protein